MKEQVQLSTRSQGRIAVLFGLLFSLATFVFCIIILANVEVEAGKVQAPQFAFANVANAQTVCGTENILFVGGSVPLSSEDQPVVDFLTAKGYSVSAIDAPSVMTSDAMGKDLVLISETALSEDIANKFTNVAVPVISWEAWTFDNLRMTEVVSTTHYGEETSQTDIVIVNASHPLAAGLSGTVTTHSIPSPLQWGIPNASAIKVATLVTDPTRYTIFAYDTGATLFDGFSAPARRVGLTNVNGSQLNANGWSYFEAAVIWAINCSPAAVPIATAIIIPTVGLTPTVELTPTVGLTPTVVIAPTFTPTLTPTVIITPTFTPTFTPTAIITPTFTPTFTPTAIITPTFTPTLTPTAIITPTFTPTFAPTAIITPTATFTPIPPIDTPIPMERPTPTETSTPTATPVLPPGNQLLVISSGSGSDDAEEILSTGAVSISSADLEMGNPSQGEQLIGIRFPNLTIPAGATITNAYIEFTADEQGITPSIFQIVGEQVLDAAPFSFASGNISSRPSTSAVVTWTPAAVWLEDGVYASENIGPILQELIAQDGWNSGNSIAVKISATSAFGMRSVAAYDYRNPDGIGPRLVVMFDPTGGPTLIETPTPTLTPAPTETSVLSIATEVPTEAPTPLVLDTPTAVPTDVPTAAPTDAPTDVPTGVPTDVPTMAPTDMPTEVPTDMPTETPTPNVDLTPTDEPSAATATPVSAMETATTAPPVETPTETPTEAPVETPIETPNRPFKTPTPAPTSTPVPAPPALSVQLADELFDDVDGDGIRSPGDIIRFNVRIVNSGDLPATGLIYSGTVGPYMFANPASISTSQGTIIQPTIDNLLDIEFDLGTLDGNGAEINLFYDVVINNPLADSVGEIEHFGTVSSNELADRVTDDPKLPGQFDRTVMSISASPLLRISMDDLLLIDSDNDQIVSSGDVLIYVVNVTNLGNAVARDITIQNSSNSNIMLIPGTVANEQGTVVRGNSAEDREVIIEIDSLAGGGGKVTVSYQVIVVDNIDGNEIANQIMSTYQNTIDPSGKSVILSDDPDTEEAFDITLTRLISDKPQARLFQTYVPLINQQLR